MKILFLTNNLECKDGWSRYSFDLINELKKERENEIVVICQKRNKNLSIKQYNILTNPQKYILNLFFIFRDSIRVKKILKKEKPDIVHLLVEPYASLFLFIPKKFKLLITVHGTYAIPSNLFRGIKKVLIKFITNLYYKKIDKIISVSEFTKKYLLKNFPYLRDRVVVISNGISLKNKFLLKKVVNNGFKKILFVGAVKSRKGLVESILALSEYKKTFDLKFRYYIIGSISDNVYLKKIRDKIRELNLEKNIIFLGKISEKELLKHYETSDLYLMLPINCDSQFEGFGLVYLEANAYGIPVIGSINSGAEEAILDNKTGYLVDPYRPEAISCKINLILNKKIIDPIDCFNWVKKNDIKNKIKYIDKLYKII